MYPYIVDTSLFQGFNGWALCLIPMLRKENVAECVYSKAFHQMQEEVYIPWYSYWMGIGMLVIRPFSERIRIQIVQTLMGDGMRTLRVREKQE